MYNNSMSNYKQPMYETYTNQTNRGPFLPFIVGGVAGTALGYGLANNNFLSSNQRPLYYPYPPMPCNRPIFYQPPYPYYY